MEDKLELKEVAAYLPYGLKCHGMGEILEGTEYDQNPIPKLLTVVGVEYNQVSVEGIKKTITENIHIEDCLPILFPLDYLTKEIEVNGEQFVPIEKLQCLYEFEKSDLYAIRMYIDSRWTTSITELPYDLVKLLISWKFDIFGLIKRGLAIPVTEEFNPYK